MNPKYEDFYRDNFGIIVQRDGDDGDSLHRQATLCFGLEARGDYRQTEVWRLFRLYQREGVWTRGMTKWTDPKTVSRDQLIPVLAMLGMGRYDSLKETTIKGLKGPLLKAPNGDPFITHLSVIIRSWAGVNLWWYLPTALILTFTDLFFLVGTLIKCFFPWRWNDQQKKIERADMDKVDDWNDVIPLLQAARLFESPTSWLARQIYRTFRPRNYGHRLTDSWDRVYQALLWYNRYSSGGNPALVEVYKPMLDRYFSTPSLVRKGRQLMGKFGWNRR